MDIPASSSWMYVTRWLGPFACVKKTTRAMDAPRPLRWYVNNALLSIAESATHTNDRRNTPKIPSFFVVLVCRRKICNHLLADWSLWMSKLGLTHTWKRQD